MTNELKDLFHKWGCDKGHKHRYHEIYEPIFAPKKSEPINFLEIGIWKGAGAASLIDYFDDVNVYGLDIFTRMTPEEVPVLQHERMKWAKTDSTNIETVNVLAHDFGVEYDYILDDGAHHPEANLLTFRYCSPFLKSGGVYIIEDVWPLERMSSEQLKHPWLVQNADRYSLAMNEKFLAELDNSGMSIERFDNRHVSGQPDSYAIVLRKD